MRLILLHAGQLLPLASSFLARVAGVGAVRAGQPAGHGGRAHGELPGGGGAAIPEGGAGLHAGGAQQPPHDGPGGGPPVALHGSGDDAPAELRRAPRSPGRPERSRANVAEGEVAAGGGEVGSLLCLVHVQRGRSAVGSLVAVEAGPS
jgi:hypothetical protein